MAARHRARSVYRRPSRARTRAEGRASGGPTDREVATRITRMSDSLFDNEKPVATKRSRAPKAVIEELVNRFGVARQTAEKWHARQALAVLYKFRGQTS